MVKRFKFFNNHLLVTKRGTNSTMIPIFRTSTYRICDVDHSYYQYKFPKLFHQNHRNSIINVHISS